MVLVNLLVIRACGVMQSMYLGRGFLFLGGFFVFGYPRDLDDRNNNVCRGAASVPSSPVGAENGR